MNLDLRHGHSGAGVLDNSQISYKDKKKTQKNMSLIKYMILRG